MTKAFENQYVSIIKTPFSKHDKSTLLILTIKDYPLIINSYLILISEL